MKVRDVIERLEHFSKISRNNADREFVIPIYSPGSIGVAPHVAVNEITLGFDWENSLVFAHPKERLTSLTPEQVSAILDSVRKGQSWHSYQQYKRHEEKVAVLKNRIIELEKEIQNGE